MRLSYMQKAQNIPLISESFTAFVEGQRACQAVSKGEQHDEAAIPGTLPMKKRQRKAVSLYRNQILQQTVFSPETLTMHRC
jgi:hypothetical protein